MITELYKATNADAGIQKALEYLHKNVPPVTYTTVEPTIDKVPLGGFIVHDDGTNRRVYMRTASGAVGYATLTVITA